MYSAIFIMYVQNSTQRAVMLDWCLATHVCLVNRKCVLSREKASLSGVAYKTEKNFCNQRSNVDAANPFSNARGRFSHFCQFLHIFIRHFP
jgi:hypothetical protein